jgi:hypothetical protein
MWLTLGRRAESRDEWLPLMTLPDGHSVHIRVLGPSGVERSSPAGYRVSHVDRPSAHFSTINDVSTYLDRVTGNAVWRDCLQPPRQEQ